MYRVRWLEAALDELADQWTRATSEEREAITSAAYAAERRLAEAPADEGESRLKGRRITFVPPLALTFRVFPDDGVVIIIHVRVFRRRR